MLGSPGDLAGHLFTDAARWRRAQLSHADPQENPLDRDGKPRNPWVLGLYALGTWLSGENTGAEFTFALNADTAIPEGKKFARLVANEQKNYPGRMPVIRFESVLRRGSRGDYFVPRLPIVRWYTPDGQPRGATELDDRVPF